MYTIMKLFGQISVFKSKIFIGLTPEVNFYGIPLEEVWSRNFRHKIFFVYLTRKNSFFLMVKMRPYVFSA